MAALSKLAIDVSYTRGRRISDLAVVTLFSLVGLLVTLLAARYGIDVADGM